MNSMNFWWRLVRFRWGLHLFATIWYSLYMLSLAFSGLILRAFFDHLAAEPGGLRLDAIVGLQLLNTLLAMAGLGLANYTSFYPFQHAVRALLFRNMLARILERPGAQPLPVGQAMSVGVALNILRDDVAQFFDWDLGLGDLIALALTALVALTAMVRVSLPITLGVFVPLIVMVLITDRLSTRVETYRQASRDASGQVTGAISEIFGAIQAIQVHNAEARILAHFQRLNEARRQSMVRDQLLTRLLDALANNTSVIGTALLLIFAARAMQAGTFTIGDFALFVTYIWPITTFFRTVVNTLLVGYKQTGIAVARMQTLMQGAPPTQLTDPAPVYLTGPLPPLPPVIRQARDRLSLLEVQGLRYGYPTVGEEAAAPASPFRLHDIHLRLSRGSLTVITGRIGAGKTTLLRVLLGLLPKDGGAIYWNGQLVTDPATFFTPPRIAYTPQTPCLFSTSVRDNILLGVTAAPTTLTNAIDLAVLFPDIATMDHGLDTLIGPRGMRLSGGQVQRTAAARMFVRAAELLVFDDLSSALDLETETLLWQRLFAQEQRPTCLVVSHRPAVLQRADQILVLKDGHATDTGKFADLLTHSAELRALQAIQADQEFHPGQQANAG